MTMVMSQTEAVLGTTDATYGSKTPTSMTPVTNCAIGAGLEAYGPLLWDDLQFRPETAPTLLFSTQQIPALF